MNIIECSVTMELIEGEHFKKNEENAKRAFIDMLKQLIDSEEIDEYIQTRVIE